MKHTHHFSRHRVAVAIAAAMLPSVLMAQTSEPLRMPAMEVIGSDEESILRQTGAFVIVDREQIERIQHRRCVTSHSRRSHQN